MNGVNVRASIEKKLYDLARPSHHSAVERRATRAISSIQEGRVRIKEFAHTANVAGVGSPMDIMIVAHGRRRRTAALIPSLLQQNRNGLMATLSGHFNQAEAVVPIPLRVGAGLEKKPHHIEMSFSNRKVNRRRIEIAFTAPVRIGRQQVAHRDRVAIISGHDDIPGYVLDVGRFDHFVRNLLHLAEVVRNSSLAVRVLVYVNVQEGRVRSFQPRGDVAVRAGYVFDLLSCELGEKLHVSSPRVLVQIEGRL